MKNRLGVSQKGLVFIKKVKIKAISTLFIRLLKQDKVLILVSLRDNNF